MRSLPVLTAFACVLVVGASAAADEAPARSSDAQSILMGVAPGYALFKGQPGFWLEAGAWLSLPAGSRVAVELGLGPLLTGFSRETTLDFGRGVGDETTHDEVLALGAVARAHVTYRWSSWSGARFGLLTGAVHLDLDSSICGSASHDGPFYGASVGPNFWLGRHVEAALSLDLVNYPILRCTNGGRHPADDLAFWPMVHRRDELNFDDPTLVVLAHAAYRF